MHVHSTIDLSKQIQMECDAIYTVPTVRGIATELQSFTLARTAEQSHINRGGELERSLALELEHKGN